MLLKIRGKLRLIYNVPLFFMAAFIFISVIMLGYYQIYNISKNFPKINEDI